MSSRNAPCSCPVCHLPFANQQGVDRHMSRFHPTEWTASNAGRQHSLHPCDIPGCNKLANNSRRDAYVSHLSRVHGIDSASMRRTTNLAYLRDKNRDILEMHITQEGTELNELNNKIRDIERCFARDPPAGGYLSCHGFDILTTFDTSVEILSGLTKTPLVAYLQKIRNTRKEVGSLYTRRGVMDTREGVYNDLESLLDTADGDESDDLEELSDGAGSGPDNTGPENTRAENTRAENTRAENTRAENTRAENTRAENTRADNTGHGNTGHDDPGFDDVRSRPIANMTPEEATRLLLHNPWN